MGYRELYFKNHKGVRNPLTGKTLYRCDICGNWFEKKDIDIDHIVPKSVIKKLPVTKAMKNDLMNNNLTDLRATCYHCNRSRGNRDSLGGTVGALTKNAVKNGLKQAITGGNTNRKRK